MKDPRHDFNQVVAAARTPTEVEGLFSSLFTPSEYEDFVKRWQIVRLLQEGWTQRAVRDHLQVSIATVTRGARELKHGDGTLQAFLRRLARRR